MPLQTNDKSASFQTLVLAVLLTVLLGWLLKEGQAILMPIFVAIISVYVLTTASEALGRWPLTRLLPEWSRRILVLLIFVSAIVVLAGVATVTIEQLFERAPAYQQNLEEFAAHTFGLLGFQKIPDWTAIQAVTVGRLDASSVLGSLLKSVGSLSGLVLLVAVYAMFLMSERNSFARKLTAALPHRENAQQTQRVIQEINQKIGDYLAVKTLVNAILGAISYGILLLFGVDFALFWAVLIGLLNYIPYVGSMLGVAFPVLLTVAQFGSIQTTVLVAALLIVAQTCVGNVLEPRMIGHKVNLSPFVVLISLAVWSALWGVAGAILAIPMTAVLAICFAEFPATRPLAVLLADDVTIYEQSPGP